MMYTAHHNSYCNCFMGTQAAQFADNEVACRYVFSEDLSSLPICV